jgi:hypothetical protein
MVEPPGNFRGAGILEVDDGILVAIEFCFVEERSSPVQQPAENEFRVVANSLPVETRKQGRRAGAVKTLVVVEDLDSQNGFPVSAQLPQRNFLGYRNLPAATKG